MKSELGKMLSQYEQIVEKYKNWTFDEELIKLWALSTIEKILYIGNREYLTMKQWNDNAKHWRAGISWNDDDVKYLVEQPELDQCLNSILGYIIYDDEWFSISHSNSKFLHDSKIVYCYSTNKI